MEFCFVYLFEFDFSIEKSNFQVIGLNATEIELVLVLYSFCWGKSSNERFWIKSD
jgi:hypothetical protein